MIDDKRLYFASCAAGAYSAAAMVYFIPAVYERLEVLAADFSLLALLGLFGIAGDLFVAALRALPAAIMGMMAGMPALFAGLVLLRRYGGGRPRFLLMAGAGAGLANGGLVILLRMDADTVPVLCGFTLAGLLSVFYRLRAERERSHYN